MTMTTHWVLVALLVSFALVGIVRCGQREDASAPDSATEVSAASKLCELCIEDVYSQLKEFESSGK